LAPRERNCGWAADVGDGDWDWETIWDGAAALGKAIKNTPFWPFNWRKGTPKLERRILGKRGSWVFGVLESEMEGIASYSKKACFFSFQKFYYLLLRHV
jgi:hypothetical protein